MRKEVTSITIGAWFVVWVIVVFGLIVAGLCLAIAINAKTPYERTARVGFSIATAVTVLITVAICWGFIWYRNNSESGRRALRDQESNLSGGIERTVSVYDVNGNLIKEYSGKFDIETDHDSYILFDDENGNRHMIYYTTGTIIVDEN